METLKKYSFYKSGADTKDEMQTLSVPGKGRGQKTPTEKLRVNVQISHRTERSPSYFFLPTLVFLLSQLRENVCPSSGQPGPDPAKLGPAQAHSFPPRSSLGLQGLWEPKPKSQGLLNTEGKKHNPTPCMCTFPSKTVQKQTSTAAL